MHWREFFESYKRYVVPARYYECEAEFTVEEMYKAFKARLRSELNDEPPRHPQPRAVPEARTE